MKIAFAAVAVAFLLLLGSCSKHPLAGSWQEHVPAGEGRGLEFDAGSKLIVHDHHRADGGPQHLDGSYVLDGESLKVEWTDGGKKFELEGKLQGDHIELSGGGAKLEFHRGEDAHGH